MEEKCQLIVLLKLKNMVFGNKSLKCHVKMFPQSHSVSSVTSAFGDGVGYFYGGKCSVEMQNINVYINLYWMSHFIEGRVIWYLN